MMVSEHVSEAVRREDGIMRILNCGLWAAVGRLGVVAGLALMVGEVEARETWTDTQNSPKWQSKYNSKRSHGGKHHAHRRKHRRHRLHCNKDQDREAILKMVGTFAVTFSFQEIEAIAPDYELQPEPYNAEGIEVVAAMEDEPGRIVLQHVLLIPIGPEQYYPLKHWRQDWVFEDTDLLEFQGNRNWRHRSLSKKKARCTWSQAVSQVDDGPRYESYGRWVHGQYESSWTSKDTFRPLPRREFSVRNDYDLLLAINKHTVGPWGWDHEEDNLKWVLGNGRWGYALAREEGLNIYPHYDNALATAAGLEYLERTKGFWEDVRAEWEELLDGGTTVNVATTVDGFAPYDHLFPLADELADVDPATRQETLHEILAPYVTVVEEGGSCWSK